MPETHPVVTILSGVRGDTRRYRSIHPSEQLRLAGVECFLSHITDPALPGKIAGSSIAIFHRTPFNRQVERLINDLQRRGGLVVLDVDDLVFDPAAFEFIASPDFADPVRAALYQEDMRRHRQTLEACHAVLASTAFLADQVRRLGKPVWVHRNAFSLEMLALSRAASAPGYRLQQGQDFVSLDQPASRVVIGYASGTPTHDYDFQVVKPALLRTLRRFPRAELWLAGPLNPGPGWDDLEARIHRFELRPWRSLPALLAQFDINLAPLLLDNPFARSKSEIKFVEAALVQVPTIASPTQAFSAAIRPGETGFLAETQAEWEDLLARLVEDAPLRRAAARRAHEHVLEDYHPCGRAAQLVGALDQLSQQVLGRPVWQPHALPRPLDPEQAEADLALWTAAEVELEPTLARMALYNLRHRGPATLLKQLWIYIRRMLAPIFPYNSRPVRNE